MSWFRGKSKEPEKTVSAPESFVSDSSSLSSFEGPTNFASDSRGSTLGGGSGAGGGGSLAELQAAVQAEQQRAALQAVVGRLTDLAFTKCVQKPSSSLSSSEQSCIHATVLKYFDTSEFVLGRLMKAQQSGGGM